MEKQLLISHAPQYVRYHNNSEVNLWVVFFVEREVRVKSDRDETSNELLPPATKLGQGYVFTGVCDSVHRGGICLSACWNTTPPGSRHPPEQTPPWSRHPLGTDTPQSRHPFQSKHPPSPPSMLGDTVNAQAVRILLEYILVVYVLGDEHTSQHPYAF